MILIHPIYPSLIHYTDKSYLPQFDLKLFEEDDCRLYFPMWAWLL